MRIIREYQDNDRESVNNILKSCFSKEKINNHSDDNHIELVAVLDGEVVGYLLITKLIDFVTGDLYCYIDYLCVLEKYRNQGMGRMLVLEALSISKDSGAKFVELTSSRFRKAARSLYQDLGFVIRESDMFRREF